LVTTIVRLVDIKAEFVDFDCPSARSFSFRSNNFSACRRDRRRNAMHLVSESHSAKHCPNLRCPKLFEILDSKALASIGI
jgi:hypothetical protein